MKVLVPLPIDLSVMANGRTLRVVHLLRELNHCCDLTCLVPGDHRLEAAGPRPSECPYRIGLSPPPAEKTAPGPRTCCRSTLFHERPCPSLGSTSRPLRAAVRVADRYDTVFGFDTISLAYLLAVGHNRRGRRPRLVVDMIDDPWIIYKRHVLRHALLAGRVQARPWSSAGCAPG